MRLITTCLRWELAQQPPVVLEITSIAARGRSLVVIHTDGHEEVIDGDLEMVHRVLP